MSESTPAMEDVVVVGGGPAGAACALWLHQLGLGVLLLEAGPAIGGLQLRSPYVNRWIPGLTGHTGREVAGLLQAQLDAAGVPYAVGARAVSIRYRAEPGAWEVFGERRMRQARCVVIATGARPRSGGFVESDSVGIGPGESMERLAVRGRRVAILGGGDNAFDQAIMAARRGAVSVDVYCRRRPRAQPILQCQVPSRNVHVGPFEVDMAGLRVNGNPYDVIGVQFGFEACVPAGLPVPLIDGCIAVDRRGAVAGWPGLYAAGEVTNFWHPCVVTALAHGAQVAKSIQCDLLTLGQESPLPAAAGG